MVYRREIPTVVRYRAYMPAAPSRVPPWFASFRAAAPPRRPSLRPAVRLSALTAFLLPPCGRCIQSKKKLERTKRVLQFGTILYTILLLLMSTFGHKDLAMVAQLGAVGVGLTACGSGAAKVGRRRCAREFFSRARTRRREHHHSLRCSADQRSRSPAMFRVQQIRHPDAHCQPTPSLPFAALQHPSGHGHNERQHRGHRVQGVTVDGNVSL